MRRLSRLLVLAGALLLPTSCGDGCGPEAPAALDAGTPPAHDVLPARVAREPVPFARVTRVEGQGASVQAGATLEPGAVLRSGGARIVVDFHRGGRLELEAQSVARLGELAPQEVLLAAGVARGLLPPAGNSPRPPMRLATAAGVVELPGAGDVLVAALPEGRAWLACIGGSVRVRTGELDPEGRPQTLTLVAGQAMDFTPAAATPFAAPSELVAARGVARGLLEAESSELESATQARAQASRVALLEALEAFETTRRRGEVLRARQRGLARTDPSAARALLPQLVDHSHALIRGRERLLVRQERAVAIALASGQELALDARVRAALDMDASVSPAAGHP